MFSGDYTVHEQYTVAGAPMPPPGWSPDLIASLDCTNGASALRSWRYEVERLLHDGLAALDAGNSVLVCASALERCPSIARMFADAGASVVVDGPSVFQLVDRPASDDLLWWEGDRTVSLAGVHCCESVGEALTFDHPHIVVAPSSHGEGPASVYLQKFLPRADALVVSSGFVGRGSNLSRVFHAHRGGTAMLQINGIEHAVPVHAERDNYRLTAHSLREALAQRVELLLAESIFLKDRHRRLVGLNHGRTGALDWFERRFETAGIGTFRSDRESDRDMVLVE